MFCSKCGKTIHADDALCPNCQAPIGDNRFGGTPYTSAQFTIAPGQTSFEPLNNYTRTTYTSMDDAAQEGGEVDSRTTYRPVYEGASAPESVRRDMRAAINGAGEEAEDQPEAQAEQPQQVAPSIVPLSPAAEKTLEELDEDLKPDEQIDRSQFRSRPIKSEGRAGISRDVSEYIRKLEDSQTKKAASRKDRSQPQNVYDDYAADDDAYDPDADYGEDVFDDIGEEEFDDMRVGSRFGIGQIVKVAVALAVIAALVFGIISWVRYVRGSQSSAPIEGVSETLYTDGVALIKSHVDSEYINGMISKYATDGIISTTAALEQGEAAILALLPEEPAANDQTFVNALQAIEKNIGNAIVMDGVAVGSASPTAVQDSEARWQIVNNSIQQLESATSAAELTAIINGQTITVQTETPAPTQAPIVYPTLSKGDESNDVKKLQDRLYVLGYLNDNRDGVFGSKTQTAVKAFQERAGMAASGIADSAMQTALYAEDAPYAPGATTPTPALTATPAPAPTDAPIQPAEAGNGAA